MFSSIGSQHRIFLVSCSWASWTVFLDDGRALKPEVAMTKTETRIAVLENMVREGGEVDRTSRKRGADSEVMQSRA
ncbi:hypothetical protein L3Y34_012366 [Caenorhabditis briggsae]|uniref:Uncharacterized protein n=1 Tax=Caenorhabditis briggsae TaxID=6238 RepID=A0AAE8ZP08_CAEBR|nr:hypothetical protein L3Y34_012366 [Caenorhabditis briggsae]